MSTDLEIIDLTEIVGEFETPCDWADYQPDCAKAEWIGHTVPCACGAWSVAVLLCDRCHSDILTSVNGAVECSVCGEVVAPAKHAFRSFERL